MTNIASILTPLLARGSDLDLSELLMYGAVLLVTVVGGIIQKLKKESAKGPKSGPGRPPSGQPPSPGPTRRAPKPTPPKPAPPRQAPAAVATPPPTAPPTRPSRAQPTVVGTPGTYTPEQLRWLVEQRQQAKPPATAPVEAIDVAPTEPAPRPAAPEPLAAAGMSGRLRRLLSDRSGLRAGILLSEILEPPLALRDPR